MADRKSMLLFLEDLEALEDLTDAEAGELFKALTQFAISGEKIETDNTTVRVLFRLISARIATNAEKYEQTCQRRREAAKKRWAADANAQDAGKEDAEQMQSDANECNSMQMHTSAMQCSANDGEHDHDQEHEHDHEHEHEHEHDTHFVGKRARARETTASASRFGVRESPAFTALWREYPADCRMGRDFLPDACVQECADHADDVRRAIAAYVAECGAKGKPPMRARDFFDGVWRDFVPEEHPPIEQTTRKRRKLQ